MIRKTSYWNWIGYIVLSLIPISLEGCSKPTTPTHSSGEESTLEIKAQRLEEQLRLKTAEYDRLFSEKENVVKERDDLMRERQEYPRNTPEEVIRENKSLRKQLLTDDITASLGYAKLVNLVDSNRRLRIDNLGMTKELDILRRILARKGIYLDNTTNEEIDPAESPLAIEQSRHSATRRLLDRTRAEVDQAREERNTENIRHSILVDSYKTQISVLTSQRDKYKAKVSQYEDYLRSLQIQENPRK